MKKTMLLTMLLAAVSGFGAVIEKDTLELGLQGNLDFDSPDGDVEFMVYPTLGYFFMDNIQAGGMLGMLYDGRDMGYRIGTFGEINFDTYNAVMPFLAARVMFDFGSHYDKNYLLLDTAAGLKFFLSQTLAISTEIFYDLASEDAFADDEEGGRNNDAGLRLGLRHYF